MELVLSAITLVSIVQGQQALSASTAMGLITSTKRHAVLSAPQATMKEITTNANVKPPFI